MFFDDFVSNVKILTVLKLSWKQSNAIANPRNFHALSFRTKANVRYTVNNNTISVHEGDILFVPENLSYHIQAEEEELYVIHFELPEKKQNSLEVFHIGDFSKAKRLFSNCYEIWNQKESGYYFKTLSIFYRIIEMMEISVLEKNTDKTYQDLLPAVQYIHAHFEDASLTVLQLCKIVHMSDTWFRKLFIKCYGTTPIKYINNLRINYAKELIESGYYKIENIASLVGFNDPKYFSIVFKQYTGCSPSTYRDSKI